MDYYDLLLKGYANTSNRKHFDRYLFRAFKEAELLHFSAEEFYDGCYEVIKSLKDNLDNKVESYRYQYEKKISMIDIANGLPSNLKATYIEKHNLKDSKFYQKLIDNSTTQHGWEQLMIDDKVLKINYKLIELLNQHIENALVLSNASFSVTQNGEKKETSYLKTALICAYNNLEIKRSVENPVILERFKLNSWIKLYNEYKYVQRRVDRRAKPFPYTKTKLKNKINLFKNICEFIEEEFRWKIEEDIKLLNSFMESDFD